MTTPEAAAPDWELWGTFSVADHLRRRPFVADVLIYDKLVVPVPAEGDQELLRKWERRWNPARQSELLEVIDSEMPGLVYRVPWTADHDRRWREHAEREGLRLGLASDVSRDVDIIRTADPDSIGQLGERRYLVDFVDPRRDRELRSAVPPGNVEVVAAYGSRDLFNRDVPVETEDAAAGDSTLLSAFAWPLVVPSSSQRSDSDLLKAAAEEANRPETRDYRLAYHQWRGRLPSGTTPKEARQQLEDIIRRYGVAKRRTQIRTRIRQAVLVLTAGAAAAGGAVTDPAAAFGIGTGAAGLEQYLDARALRTRVPGYIFPGALFHEARERLGWRTRR